MNKTFTILLRLALQGAGAALLCLLAATVALGQSYAGRMGVEAPGDVFVDMAKQSYRWDKPDGAGGWTGLAAADVDANGWPKTDVRWISDNRPVQEWFGTIDDPDGYRINRSGTYKGSFTGQATLTGIEGPFTVANQVYNSSTNTTTFDLTIPAPGPGHGLVIMSFTNTRRTSASAAGTGIANFKLIRPGYAANTTQVFTNQFISTLTNAKFSVVRFMGAGNINNNIEYQGSATAFQPWANRKKPTDAAQTGMGPLNKKDGWCYEYMIDVCNQANMDLWLNIPVAVDNNYITELAKLVKARLNTNLRVYLEHANEVWNFGFLQYSWNKNRASEESALAGFNLNYDGSTDVEIWGQRRHARRLKEAVDIFAGQFGASEINNRIRGVLAGVTTDPNGFFISGRLPGMLKYLSDNYGPPKNYIYTTAIPLYYGGDAAAGKPGTESFTVAQIIDAMRASSDADVANRRSAVTLATTTYQLPGGHSSYEGGPDLGAGEGLTANLANRIRAVRDAAQKDVYKRNFATNFWDLGGNIAMQFTLASPYSRFGAWGLTDDINIPDRNFLFAAVRELIGAGGTTPTPPTGNGTGLRAEYFNNRTLAAPAALTRTDATVNNDWGGGAPATGVNADNFSVRWTGRVLAPVTGTYSFSTVSDDGVRLWVNNVQIINNWTDHAPTTDNGSQTFNFTAGQKYDIRMEYYENAGGAVARLRWAYPGQATQVAIPQSQLFPATAGTGGTDVTLTFEGAATGTFAGAYTESGYRLSEGRGDSYVIHGTANGYQSKVYHPNNWDNVTTLARTDNGLFDLKSFGYASGLFGDNGDATVKGYKSDNTTVTQTYSFSSKTQSTLTLNWTSLTKVEINFGGGVNNAYGALDNFSLTTRTSARLLAEKASVAEWMVFPNPATETLDVRFQANDGQTIRYSLFNTVGQRLFLRTHEATGGENTLNVPVRHLSAGVYILVVEKDGKRMSERISVTR